MSRSYEVSSLTILGLRRQRRKLVDAYCPLRIRHGRRAEWQDRKPPTISRGCAGRTRVDKDKAFRRTRLDGCIREEEESSSNESWKVASYETSQSRLAPFLATRSMKLTNCTSQRHLDLLEARKVLVRDLSEKHNIPGFNRELLSVDDMNEFEEKLEEAISAQQAKIEKIKVGHADGFASPRRPTEALPIYRTKRELSSRNSKKRFRPSRVREPRTNARSGQSENKSYVLRHETGPGRHYT